MGMRRILLLTVVLAAAVGSGCTSTYWANRGRDAADIVTLTLGTGFGVKAQVGPIQPAIIITHDIVGLRSGAVVPLTMDIENNYEMFFPIPIDEGTMACGAAYFHPGETGEKRRKDLDWRSPFPLVAYAGPKTDPDVFSPQYTQIEVAGGAILTARLGVNVGELVDFLLGWFGVDMYKDDLE